MSIRGEIILNIIIVLFCIGVFLRRLKHIFDSYLKEWAEGTWVKDWSLVTILLVFVGIVAFQVLMLSVNLFGLSDASDELSGQKIHQVLNWWYPDNARKQYSVILFSDRSFQRLASEKRLTQVGSRFVEKNIVSRFPPSYEFQAEVLARIAQYKPKAIFLDWIFDDERPGVKGWDGFVNEVKKIVTRKGVPIFIASYKPSKRPDLFKYAIPVAPTSATSNLVGTVTDYPFFDRYDRDSPMLPTPAVAIYDKLFGGKIGVSADKKGNSMRVVWGVRPSKLTASWLSTCHAPVFSENQGLVDGVIHRVYDRWPTCPYADSTLVDDLFSKNEVQGLSDLIKNRVVAYGANVTGNNDTMVNSIGMTIPGVYYHMMALDNFLTFGEGYKRPSTTGSDESFVNIFFVSLNTILAFLFSLFATYEVWSSFFGRLVLRALFFSTILIVSAAFVAYEYLVKDLSIVNWVGTLAVGGAALSLNNFIVIRELRGDKRKE